jgi:hypothetical protein
MNPKPTQTNAALHRQRAQNATQFGRVWIAVFTLSTLSLVSVHATVYNSNGSASDVQNKIGQCVDGDTVTIPAGSFNWGTTPGAVTISGKAITLAGAGSGSTTVAVPGSQQGGAILEIQPSNNSTTRVTGITFEGGYGVDVNGSKASSPFRIDNCVFDDGTVNSTNLLQLEGNAPGLIDHCTFQAGDASEMIHNNAMGAQDASGWTDDVLPGGPELVYIENCTFTTEPLSNASQYFASAIQSYYGARTCMRYCTLNYCQIDQHGTAGMIGSRWWEFYDNTFYVPPNNNQSNYFALRAGSGVVFNNHVAGGPNLGDGVIELVEEDTGYPALYQIGRGINETASPAYIWGNDAAMTVVSGSSNVVQGRDYFVSTTQPSSMTRSELAADNGGVQYNYVPYTYPHPLENSGGSPPSTPPAPPPPTGLHIVP